MHDLSLLIREQIDKAHADPHGRSAHLLVHDGQLRQTVIALTAGTVLDEHNAPTAATIQVMYGGVRVTSDSGDISLTCGNLHSIAHERHGFTATDDAVVLLTAVTE